jgi:hypothetical protein
VLRRSASSPTVTHQTSRACSLLTIQSDGRIFDICIVHDGGPVFLSVCDEIDWIYVHDVEDDPDNDAELTAKRAVEWFLRAHIPSRPRVLR